MAMPTRFVCHIRYFRMSYLGDQHIRGVFNIMAYASIFNMSERRMAAMIKKQGTSRTSQRSRGISVGFYERSTATQHGSHQSIADGGGRGTRPASRALQRDCDTPGDASRIAHWMARSRYWTLCVHHFACGLTSPRF